jgi:hypothetical protein
VLIKRDLTDEESLLNSFSDDDDSSSLSENDKIDLELKKNFFYVVNPDGEIIDCAKIYTFLHENNIY